MCQSANEAIGGREKRRFFSLALVAALMLLASSSFAQDIQRPDDSISLPTDWSTTHVIYTGDFTADQIDQMRNDPRLYNSWLLQGHSEKPAEAETVRSRRRPKLKTRRARRDWAFSLGGGSVAQNMYPAKFSFSAGSGTLTSAN